MLVPSALAMLFGCAAAADKTLLVASAAQAADDISSVAFSPDGMQVAAGTKRRLPEGHLVAELAVWSVGSKTDLIAVGSTPSMTKSIVSCVKFTPDGKQVVTGSFDGTLKLWSASTLEPVGEANTEPGNEYPEGIASIVIVDDGATVITGGTHGKIRFWDLATLTQRSSLKAHGRTVTQLAVHRSDTGSQMVSTGADHALRVWTLSGRELTEVHKWQKPKELWFGFLHVSFSADGAKVHTVLSSGEVKAFSNSPTSLVEVEAGVDGAFFSGFDLHDPKIVAVDVLNGTKCVLGHKSGTLEVRSRVVANPLKLGIIVPMMLVVLVALKVSKQRKKAQGVARPSSKAKAE